MYTVEKIGRFNIPGLIRVSDILFDCGKDMAQKYDLHHWDNARWKTFAIAAMCLLKNQVYLVRDEKRAPIATFQTKMSDGIMRFEKLGVSPKISGRGVGSFCLRRIEEMARQAGCRRLCMEVYDRSAHALSFYEKRGYTRCGTVHTLKYTEIRMEKSIQ